MDTPDRTPSRTPSADDRRAAVFSPRTAVIAFAVIEAIVLGWMLL